MQSSIHEKFQQSADIEEAEAILRSCVHCGFCNATCPTYLQLADERDGPRGRIYLLKQFLEDGEATENTRTHLDRCLSCKSCETTCPSGVQYERLLDIGRGMLERELPRPLPARILRWMLRKTIAYRDRFALALGAARMMKPVLPRFLQRKIPDKDAVLSWPPLRHDRVMIALQGCVQSSATPNTNVFAARVLDRLGISLTEDAAAGCCGALSYHLGCHDEGMDFFRKNVDAWWPLIESGAEAIVMTASGCGSMVKDYGKLLSRDPDYAEKAATISEMARDLSEIVLAEDLTRLHSDTTGMRVAIHCPCSLQHGQKLPAAMDQILEKLGFDLANTTNKHLCCGSAGTYSILQPTLSRKLLQEKVKSLTSDNPDIVVTANIGCQLDLASYADVPVRHWIELLNDALGPE
jgi:glycolate oxidase iron-sulfur subunit